MEALAPPAVRTSAPVPRSTLRLWPAASTTIHGSDGAASTTGARFSSKLERTMGFTQNNREATMTGWVKGSDRNFKAHAQ